jgi:hypothetical protein
MCAKTATEVDCDQGGDVGDCKAVGGNEPMMEARSFRDVACCWRATTSAYDLLRGLAERGVLAPLLIVATARPKFRPPWSMH